MQRCLFWVKLLRHCCECFTQGSRASLWSRGWNHFRIYTSSELSGWAQWSGSVSIVHAVMDEVSTNGGSFWRKIALPFRDRVTRQSCRRDGRRDDRSPFVRRVVDEMSTLYASRIAWASLPSVSLRYPHSRINKFIYMFCRVIFPYPRQTWSPLVIAKCGVSRHSNDSAALSNRSLLYQLLDHFVDPMPNVKRDSCFFPETHPLSPPFLFLELFVFVMRDVSAKTIFEYEHMLKWLYNYEIDKCWYVDTN